MSPVANEFHPVIHAGAVAVITGAASGIGRAAAEELAKCPLFLLIKRPCTKEEKSHFLFGLADWV
jgi:hypothetical protein